MIDKLERQLARITVPALRITLGLLWLANLHWKRPGDFGETANNGLFKYVNAAVVDPEVFGPYTWLTENVILKNYQAFGWLTLLTETVLAGALIVGWKVRWMALIGAVQSAAIMLSVVNYSGVAEWPWSYYMMIAAHLGLLGLARQTQVAVDAVTPDSAKRAWGVGGAVAGVVGLLALAKVGWDSATFADERGVLLGNSWGELKFLRLNGVGGLVLVVIGALGIAAARAASSERARQLATAAAGVSGASLLLLLVQWRTPKLTGSAETGGWLGGDGGTMGVAAGLTMLFAQSVLVSFRHGSKRTIVSGGSALGE
jgi:hypothetical protein